MQSVYREVLFTLQLPALIPTVHCQCNAKLMVKYTVRKIAHNVICHQLSCAVRKVFVNIKIVRFVISVVLNKLIRVELIFLSNTACLFDGRGIFTLLPKVQLHVLAYQQ